MNETLDPREDATQEDELFRVRVEVSLTRAQLREYLGWAVVTRPGSKGPSKSDLATIKRMIRESVAVHVVTMTSELGRDWDLVATDDQVTLVDGALERVVTGVKGAA